MSNQPLQTLGEFIIDKQDDFLYSTGELSRLLSAIRLASKVVHREVNKAGIADISGASPVSLGTNLENNIWYYCILSATGLNIYYMKKH